MDPKPAEIVTPPLIVERRIMGVDLGNRFAWCISPSAGIYDAMTLAHDDRGQLLYEFYKVVTDLIRQYQITHLAWEHPTAKGEPRTMARHNEMGGLLKLAGFVYDLRTAQIWPTSLKKQIAGSGRAEKDHVRIAVEKELNLPRISDYNVSDAVAVWLWASRHFNQ